MALQTHAAEIFPCQWGSEDQSAHHAASWSKRRITLVQVVLQNAERSHVTLPINQNVTERGGLV